MRPQSNLPPSPFEGDSILYYPHIEFFSTEWLKRALTIWDRVYRVVPASYTPNDTDEVREAIDAGLIQDLRLNQDDLTEVSEMFIEFLGSPAGRPAGLCPELVTETVHEEKIDARLRPLMRGLCQKVGTDVWLELPREIANGYMLFLADVVARRRNLPRLTDNPDLFTVMQFYACDGQISDFVFDSDASEATSALTMQTLVPAGISHTPMKTVLDFRKQSEEGRIQFRSGVAQLISELAQIDDAEFAQERVNLFMEQLRLAPEIRRSGLKAFGENISSMLFSIAVPTALSAFSALALGTPHDPFSGLNIGSSAAVGAIAALGHAGIEYRKSWNPSKATYFVGLESEFGSSHKLHIPDYASRMDEFVND